MNKLYLSTLHSFLAATIMDFKYSSPIKAMAPSETCAIIGEEVSSAAAIIDFKISNVPKLKAPTA